MEPEVPNLPENAVDESSILDCSDLGLSPDELVAEINSTECENLGASNGLDGTKQTNCDDLSAMVCAIKQEVDAIASERAMVIAANDASKCQDDDDPTLASFWSRVVRFSQAITCILCEYDPFVATLLKQGKYPQILMGAVQSDANGNGYPQWVMPDEIPTEGSSKPVTSAGVMQMIQDTILSVWHLWEEEPEFTYFAQTIDGEDNTHSLTNQSEETPPAEGDTALVANDGTDNNVLYTYTDGAWVKTKVLTDEDGLSNFAVTHIVKGYYADKGVYYFHDGTNDTWQVMDVDQTELEKQITELQGKFDSAVISGDDNEYVLTTAPTIEDANAVACTEGKTTIVLVTG